jgi:hypothetical protein
MADSPVTGLQIVTRALLDIGATARGQTIPPDVALEGLDRLNGMIGGWANQTGTIPFIQRQTFTLTGGTKGSPANPYTIGIGGDFNVERPLALTGAGLVLFPGLTTEVEIPRAVITDDMFEANQLKNMQNPLFSWVYYNQTYAGNLGTIVLWPVPQDTTTKIALYWRQQVAGFANLNTQYTFPPGYAEAFEFNLAMKWAPGMGRKLADYQDVVKFAIDSLGWIKTTNTQIFDVPQDPAITHDQRAGYNINTGQGG